MTIPVTDPSSRIYDNFIKDKDIKPHARQEDFLAIPDDVFEALYGGAAYGGKSWILTLLPLFRGFYKYKGFKGIILRRKFPDLEREIIRLSKEYYPQTGGKYNEQKHTWEWPDYGSYMDFGHIQHDSDVSMYDSAQYNYCAFDELTHFSNHPYHYLVGSRVRPGGDFHIAISRHGTNPGGIGQTFVYNRFVKPCEDGYKIIRDRATGLTRIFIPALAEDNPYGMEFDPLYVKKLEILKETSEADYKAKRYGDWHAFKGSVFTTFRSIRFPGEPDNALHVIEPFHIPEYWPRILSIDWGKTAMCYAMWGAISPDRRIYVYRERGWKGRDVSYWGDEIKNIHYESNEIPVHTVLCGSAWQNRGGEEIQETFTKHTGIVAQSSLNAPGTRVAGLSLIHEFLRWEKVRELRTKETFYDIDKANRIYRMYGESALMSYRSQFLDEPEEVNIPKLQIFKNCEILTETIPMAVYDEKKTEDIAEFDGDDPLDCLRYFCKAAKSYMNGEIGNLKHQEKINEVIQTYQASGDINAYYRQMESIEKGNNIMSEIIKPIQPRGIIARRRMRRH
ncbi:MAG TPA: hypothetical protein VGK47_09830 [Nitrososphaeraceae archaeon]